MNLWQAQWREIVVFALVILVLAFRPTGLFGKKHGGEGMKRVMHLDRSSSLVAAALLGLTSLFGNDYYLRIVFMMCVYYLCAAGMNVLVGYAGQKSLGPGRAVCRRRLRGRAADDPAPI